MIRHYSLNEQGKRAYQEDSVGVFCEGDHGLFAVADGLGGHGMGTQASQCAVRCALEQYHIGCEPKTDTDSRRSQNTRGGEDYSGMRIYKAG